MNIECEINNVKDVYEQIANDFDRTRKAYWIFVHNFILTLEPKSKMLDLGCGNGKYLSVRDDIELYALDNCEKFINMINEKYPKVKTFISDVLTTPFENNYFDTIISIAVIHHLSTKERRIKMIKEIIRILKIGGKCLITAWATEHRNPKILSKGKKITETNDWLIPWEDRNQEKIFQRFYHLFEQNELDELLINFTNIKIIESKYDKDNWNITFIKIH
jgi:tRNA (uracil-5-)-methyltransferase TRM9